MIPAPESWALAGSWDHGDAQIPAAVRPGFWMQLRLSRGRMLLLALLLALCAFHSYRADLVNTQQPSDFLIFYQASLDAARGANPYLLSSQHLAYIYPPFLAWAVTPLTRLPFLAAVQVWTIFNSMAWIALIWLSVRLVWPRRRAVPAALLWIPSLLCYRFILRLNLHGQVDMIVWALVLAGVHRLRSRDDRGAGALLATALVIKPIGFLLVPYLVCRSRWRCLFYTGAFGAFLLIVPLLTYGSPRYFEILNQWTHGRIGQDLTDVSFESGSSNQSVQAGLYRFFGARSEKLTEPWPGPGGWLSDQTLNDIYLVVAVSLSAVLLRFRHRPNAGSLRWGQELALIVCTTHLVSRRTCEYHLVSLVIVYTAVLALFYLPRLGRSRPVSGALLLGAAAFTQNFYSPMFVGRAMSDRLQCLSPVPVSLLLLWWLLAQRLNPVRRATWSVSG